MRITTKEAAKKAAKEQVHAEENLSLFLLRISCTCLMYYWKVHISAINLDLASSEKVRFM